MIISRTPFRVSLFGGGTDYPAWYREHGGKTLATTINKYCYITCRCLPPFFEHKYRVVYSKAENCQSIEEIAHPAVREVLRYLGVTEGLEIHHDGDLPARSGLGSSSAFTVGLLHAIIALQGRLVAPAQLARDAMCIEQQRLGEFVGCQDQVCASYGGLNRIEFLPNDEFRVTPVALRAERVSELNAHLMLVFTGIRRTASTVASSYVPHLARNGALNRVLEMTDQATAILASDDDIGAMGTLLNESWTIKRALSGEVTSPAVEQIYEAALQAGALGGKLTGAGGGGFMLLFARPGDHARIRDALRSLIHVPFKCEFAGSRIIFHDPEEDFSRQWQEREHRPPATC